MEAKFKKYFTILAKPTYACNMKCPKCYLDFERKKKKGIMPDTVLTSLISKASDIGSEHISIQWIGGESLLVGVNFYKKAAQLIQYYKKDKQHINQCIQTNGTLLNDEWIVFLRENKNVSLSISFEVMRKLQDKVRPMKNGDSSYEVVKQNIDKLNRNNIPFGMLTVITKETLDIDPEEWVNHITGLGIKAIGLQICYQDFYWGKLEDTKKCMEWIDKLFNVQACYNQSVYSKEKYLTIRESYYLYNIMRGLPICSCSCHNSISVCSDYLLTVDTDGDVYGFCDAFMGTNDPDNSYILGNIIVDNFSSIFSSKEYNQIRTLMDNERKECEACDIYCLCNGGCPLFRSKNIKDGVLISSNNQSNYCEIQKSLFKYIRDINNRPLLRQIYHFLESNQTMPNPLL